MIQIWTIHGSYIHYPGVIVHDRITIEHGDRKVSLNIQNFDCTIYPQERRVKLSVTMPCRFNDGKVLVQDGDETIELVGEVLSFSENSINVNSLIAGVSALSTGQSFEISASLVRLITEEECLDVGGKNSHRDLIFWVE